MMKRNEDVKLPFVSFFYHFLSPDSYLVVNLFQVFIYMLFLGVLVSFSLSFPFELVSLFFVVNKDSSGIFVFQDLIESDNI